MAHRTSCYPTFFLDYTMKNSWVMGQRCFVHSVSHPIWTERVVDHVHFFIIKNNLFCTFSILLVIHIRRSSFKIKFIVLTFYSYPYLFYSFSHSRFPLWFFYFSFYFFLFFSFFLSSFAPFINNHIMDEKIKWILVVIFTFQKKKKSLYAQTIRGSNFVRDFNTSPQFLFIF